MNDAQVEELLRRLDQKAFVSGDEQEVAGYAEVMDAVFEAHTSIRTGTGSLVWSTFGLYDEVISSSLKYFNFLIGECSHELRNGYAESRSHSMIPSG